MSYKKSVWFKIGEEKEEPQTTEPTLLETFLEKAKKGEVRYFSKNNNSIDKSPNFNNFQSTYKQLSSFFSQNLGYVYLNFGLRLQKFCLK